MNLQKSRTFVCALAILCVLASVQGGAVSSEVSSDTKRTTVIESSGGIEYRVSLQANDSTLTVDYENPTTDEITASGYVVSVDGQRIYEENLNLSANEHRTEEINITPGINVNEDEHTVSFSTFGGHTQFNFTREINSTNSDKIPTPHIADVTIGEGTINGEPSAVANVTLVNPSEQLYSTKLMVHTTGTEGSLYPASVRPGDSRTITVELLDERGVETAGEARFYAGNMTTKEGALDQVEFAGRAGEQTQVWDTSYEPAKPTWMSDHYRYHNESFERSFGQKASGGHEIGGVPIIYFGLALIVGWVARRKFR
jgi:hypothetical protein